jgi:RHS repeat-associated protein
VGARVTVITYDATGTQVDSFTSPQLANALDWNTFSFSFHTGPNAVKLRLVVRLSGNAGQVVLFDNVNLLTAAVSANYNYTGKGMDGTGLVYFGSRWYDPEIGRFITRDPIRDGLNWYAYCYNNPFSYVDPDGKCPLFVITGAAGALIGGAYGTYSSYMANGQINWGQVGQDALIGGIVGATLGAGTAYLATGSALASTSAVLGGAASSWAVASGTIAVGANSATKGRVFENWFCSFNKIAQNAQQIVVNGIGRIDAFKNGTIYELKNYDWSKYSSLSGLINNFVAQATKYQNLIGQYLNGQKVTDLIYYFSSKPPIEVINALQKAGVTVQWVQ